MQFDYDKVLALTDSEIVKLGQAIKDEVNTELYLGMSDFVIEHGCLSEGHEKLTDSQRYYQAKREMYMIASNIATTRANAMEAQADLLDAEESLKEVTTYSQELRAEAKVLKAKQQITNCLVNVEDQMRQLRKFDSIRASLQDGVRAKYKNIEEAERDNWEAVLKYRMLRNTIAGKNEYINHVPYPKEEKASLGVEYGNREALVWLAITDEEKINRLHNGDIVKYLNSKDGNVRFMEDKKWQKNIGQPLDPIPG